MAEVKPFKKSSRAIFSSAFPSGRDREAAPRRETPVS
jgi:hypothetical protein